MFPAVSVAIPIALALHPFPLRLGELQFVAVNEVAPICYSGALRDGRGRVELFFVVQLLKLPVSLIGSCEKVNQLRDVGSGNR